MIRRGSGVLTPADLGQRPSNNLMELIAVVRALDPLPDGWRGTVHTDSMVTICRMRGGFRDGSVPGWLRKRVFQIKARLHYPTFILVGGHPTREELKAGHRKGRPVSRWNVFCDEECRRKAATHLS